jgi:hypothetical protein
MVLLLLLAVVSAHQTSLLLVLALVALLVVLVLALVVFLVVLFIVVVLLMFCWWRQSTVVVLASITQMLLLLLLLLLLCADAVLCTQYRTASCIIQQQTVPYWILSHPHTPPCPPSQQPLIHLPCREGATSSRHCSSAARTYIPSAGLKLNRCHWG